MSAFNINSPKIHNYSIGNSAPHLVSQSKANQIRILQQIKALGITRFGFKFSEIKYLPQLIRPTEQLGGVVQGYNRDDGHILLAATDKRVIVLDTKPMFVRSEDISYNAIAALTLEWLGTRGTLILHTRLGNFKLRVRNRKATEIFRCYVEDQCLEQYSKGLS